jgi:hypothetical protein
MSTADDDIDFSGDLDAALDGQGLPPEDDHVSAKPRDPPADKPDPFPKSDSAEYVREGRRFVRKDGKEEPVAEKPTEAQPAAKDAKQPWKPAWYREEYGPWDKLPESLRGALKAREDEVQRGMSDSGRKIKAWEPIEKTLEPYAEELQKHGIAPQQYVSNLLSWDVEFRKDPVNALDMLARSVGLDLAEIGKKLEPLPPQAAPDPEINALRQTVQQLQGAITQMQTGAAQQTRAQIAKTIEDWSNGKDHFATVENAMLTIIRGDPEIKAAFQRNPQATLDQLYDQAIWAHPATRPLMLAQQQKAGVERARAKSLDTRDRGTVNGGARSSPKMSLEEEIGSLLDAG